MAKDTAEAAVPANDQKPTELQEILRTDEKRKCAVTEKLTFEICASLIAYEVKTILGTINRVSDTAIPKSSSKDIQSIKQKF